MILSLCPSVCGVCVWCVLTGGLEGGVLVEANSQVVMWVRQGHGWTKGGQGCVVQMVMICMQKTQRKHKTFIFNFHAKPQVFDFFCSFFYIVLPAYLLVDWHRIEQMSEILHTY